MFTYLLLYLQQADLKFARVENDLCHSLLSFQADFYCCMEQLEKI